MDRAIMDIENLYGVIQKINMYRNEESVKIDEISSKLNSISGCCKNSSIDKIQNIQFELVNNLKMMKKNHENDTTVLNKNIAKYIDVETMTSQMFNNIYKG